MGPQNPKSTRVSVAHSVKSLSKRKSVPFSAKDIRTNLAGVTRSLETMHAVMDIVCLHLQREDPDYESPVARVIRIASSTPSGGS